MLSLRGLSRHCGQTVALDGLSLDVPEGEVLGFVGPSGAGNSGDDGLAFAASLLLYPQPIVYGLAVASGVVEEKSSRV